MLDIFGAWMPSNDLPLVETEILPKVIQPPQKVLAFDFEPEPCEGEPGHVQIPFHVFDHVMDIHGVDVTGLSFSSTKRGSLYRTHRLMLPAH